MSNSLNIPAGDLKKIERLTPEQLRAIRVNIQDPNMSDDETREAMMEAVADGHEVEDFLGMGPGEYQYVVESKEQFGGPYCYVKAESEQEALEIAGTPVHEQVAKYGPFAARKLRPEFGEHVDPRWLDGEWHAT